MSSNQSKLLVVTVSTRPGRLGDQVGHWFADQARSHGGFDVEQVDLATLDLPLFNEPEQPHTGIYTQDVVRRWSEFVAQADTIVFVTPEYNYFMPASLLNAMTFLHKEWVDKVVGFVGYGWSGAHRAMATAKQAAANLSMHVVKPVVPIHLADTLTDGQITPGAPDVAAARGLLDELARITPAMVALRR